MPDAEPDPVLVRAAGPARQRLAIDLALAGAAVGAVLGAAAWGRTGVVALFAGGALGGLAGWTLAPRCQTLRLDADGVHIGRLAGRTTIPWPEVAALGVEDAWSGRRGRSTALGVCRRGAEWPTTVPALTFHASGFRVGGTPPTETLAPHRERLVATVAPWAEARAVPFVPTGLDDWWDRHRA